LANTSASLLAASLGIGEPAGGVVDGSGMGGDPNSSAIYFTFLEI
jgi:hypothetical protein